MKINLKKSAILFSGIVLTAVAAQAVIYRYDVVVPMEVKNYVNQISSLSVKPRASNCSSVYEPMIQDGVLDVRYALGYFDDTTGAVIKWDGVNYGYSPSLDGAIFDVLKNFFTDRCTKGMQLCGFSSSGSASSGKMIFEKNMPIQGQNVLVRITMTYASVSEYLLENTGRRSGDQAFFTRQSEDNFFNGLKEADVVFYNGHSRNGGGPDFNPPILTRKKKTDYKGYYEVQQPGIRRTLEDMRYNPNPGFILGFFSCYSKMHFLKMLIAQNPQQRLILSADTIDYFDTLKVSIGYLEAILRGQCGADMARTAKQGEKIRRGFDQFNMNP